MSDRLTRIEARLGEVDRALAEVCVRVRALEAERSALPAIAVDQGLVPAATGTAVLPEPGGADVTGVLTLVGRTLMVLGGAYLLRALTESGRLPGRAGVVLGLAYTAAWFGAADRAGALRPLSGLFHGFAAVLIGLPLLWEASTHFGFFSPETSAVALATITGLALAVAWHRNLQSLAAVAVLGSIVATAVLVGATGRPLPFAASLVALGASTLWLSHARGWPWLRWPPALAADIVFAGLIARASMAAPLDRPGAVVALQLLLVAAYAGSVIWRTLVGHRRVLPFEMLQVVAVVAIGLGGALVIAHGRSGQEQLALGGLSLLAAAAAYTAAFGIVERQPESGLTFGFYVTLALALTLIASASILTGLPRLLCLSVLALVATGLGARFSRPALALHGAIFSVAAAMTSGVIAMAATVWLTAGSWPSVTIDHGLALFVAALCVAIPRSHAIGLQDGPPPLMTVASRLILDVLVIAGVGAIAVGLVAPVVAGRPLDIGILASTKTAMLAASVLLIAVVSRFRRWVEFGWLVYPVLVVGGIKLVVDDFRHSAPATLFLALALYGAALFVAPRVVRRS